MKDIFDGSVFSILCFSYIQIRLIFDLPFSFSYPGESPANDIICSSDRGKLKKIKSTRLTALLFFELC